MPSRKQAENSGYTEEMMHLAVEASPNGMVMMNRGGNIVLVNSTTENLFGYRREELIGESIEILVPERFRDKHPELRQGYYKQPRSRAMGQGRDLYGLHKNGTEFPVEIGLNPVETETDLYVLAAIVDITDRKHAEDMMRLAVEASPNGMVMTNHEGTIVMVNSTAEVLFGYTREQLIGRAVDVLVPESFRSHHPQMRNQYLQQPKTRAMGQGRDLYGLHASGREFPVEIGLNPIRTPQGIMVLSSIVDITERKQQEQQIMAALSEKELLLAEIHHRVKNNLQIIDSLLGMQSDMLVDSKVTSVLRESQNRVKSMALIHQTLYESLDFSRVDITNVIRNLVDNLCNSYALDTSKIRVVIEIDQVYLPMDISIPLGLIINELCSNAMKHAFKGRSTGIMQLDLKYMAGGNLRLVVSDDGVGIPEGFDIENATSLGLQLIQLLSEQISAELVIQRSSPTRFVLDIPQQH